MTVLQSSIIASAALLLCACAAERRPPYVIRDSATVEIVENRAGDEPRLAPFSIDSVPIFHVGDDPAEPMVQFHQIAGITRLSDGRVVIANGSTGDIRYFGKDGSLLKTFGGPGDGPGLFRRITRLWRARGDTILVFDAVLGRVSKLSPTAELVTTFSIVSDSRRPLIMGALDDTTLLGYWRMPFSPEHRTSGVTRDTVYLRAIRFDGEARGDSIGPVAAGEYLLILRENGVSVATRAFGRTLRTAIASGRIAVSSQDSFVFDIYAGTGELIRSVRLARANTLIEDGDVERHRRDWLGDIRDPRQRSHDVQLLEAMTYPEAWPAHGAMEFDELGYLWVRRPTTYRDSQPQWEVFGPRGIWLGAVKVPQGFGVFEIGRDYILGRWRDSDDVEHVRSYRLRRLSH